MRGKQTSLTLISNPKKQNLDYPYNFPRARIRSNRLLLRLALTFHTTHSKQLAANYGLPVYEVPVGFKYVGQYVLSLIRIYAESTDEKTLNIILEGRKKLVSRAMQQNIRGERVTTMGNLLLILNLN